MHAGLSKYPLLTISKNAAPVKFHCTCGGDSMVICIPPIIGSLQVGRRVGTEEGPGCPRLEVDGSMVLGSMVLGSVPGTN